MAIAIPKGMQVQDLDVLRDPRGRYIFVKFKVDDMPLTMASIYTPNSDQIGFLKSTLEALAEFRRGELLLGGDFNLISTDTTGGRRNKQTPGIRTRSACFKSLLDSYNLADIWRFLYPL